MNITQLFIKGPFDILMGSVAFQEAFVNLGFENYDIEELFRSMDPLSAICTFKKKRANVNRAKMEIFNKTYKVSDTSRQFSLNVRNYDPCNLPLQIRTSATFIANKKYIACLCRNAHCRIHTEMSPTDCGWKNVVGKLEPTWNVFQKHTKLLL